MLARAHAFTIDGLQTRHVTVEVDVRAGLPAFVIGGLEVLSVLANELHLSGPFWGPLSAVNGETAWQYVGFGIIALFVVTWLVAMAVYRVRRYEEIGFPPVPPTADPERSPSAPGVPR